MSEKKVSYNSGIGLRGMMFLVFLVLKLTHEVDWSWWWVTAPIWIPYAVALAVMAFFAVVAAITGLR